MSAPHKRESINCEAEMELRRGPWTHEEDTILIHYIALHGEGRWNLLARSSGLKRTGKSCRLRWLNYLKPDVKRGNISPQEQFLILELHSKWGNRWSRIAQHLPGRTDNEIKNYWRTRVQKQARQLRIDANSAMFRDALRCYWIPRLLMKMASPPPPSLCPAAEFETPHQTLNQAPLCDSAAPEHFHPGAQWPPFYSCCSEDCSPSMSAGRARPGGFHIEPDGVEIDPFLNGEHCTTFKPHDELDLAAETLASPNEISCFYGGNSADYGGFFNGLWN